MQSGVTQKPVPAHQIKEKYTSVRQYITLAFSLRSPRRRPALHTTGLSLAARCSMDRRVACLVSLSLSVVGGVVLCLALGAIVVGGFQYWWFSPASSVGRLTATGRSLRPNAPTLACCNSTSITTWEASSMEVGLIFDADRTVPSVAVNLSIEPVCIASSTWTSCSKVSSSNQLQT